MKNEAKHKDFLVDAYCEYEQLMDAETEAPFIQIKTQIGESEIFDEVINQYSSIMCLPSAKMEDEEWLLNSLPADGSPIILVESEMYPKSKCGYVVYNKPTEDCILFTQGENQNFIILIYKNLKAKQIGLHMMLDSYLLYADINAFVTVNTNY